MLGKREKNKFNILWLLKNEVILNIFFFWGEKFSHGGRCVSSNVDPEAFHSQTWATWIFLNQFWRANLALGTIIRHGLCGTGTCGWQNGIINASTCEYNALSSDPRAQLMKYTWTRTNDIIPKCHLTKNHFRFKSSITQYWIFDQSTTWKNDKFLFIGIFGIF